MARKKRPSKVRPKTPSRVRKRTTRRKIRSHHHPELIGLGLLLFGPFMFAVLYVGWNGGYVGKAIGDGLVSLVGGTAYTLPVACIALGGLMVARSDLPRFGPFRTGLILIAFALALVLGSAHGGYLGEGLESLFGRLLGTTGTRLLGVFVLIAGVLLVSGASAGAILRRSGHAMRRAARARPSRRAAAVAPPPLPEEADSVVPAAVAPPIDGVEEFPDVVSPPPLLVFDEEPQEPEPAYAEQASLFDVVEGDEDAGVYSLPDAGVLRRSKGVSGDSAQRTAHIAETLVAALGNFGVDATVVGEIAGPRVTRYELHLAPGTKVSKVAGLKDDLSYALATTEIRILAPIPGKSAVGVEVPNHSPNIVTLGDIFDDLPATASPLSVWLGKDISGNAVWTDLARMPHLLIAGTTGSGKSGCINTLLTSILLRATPDEVRMILIDPKRIELNFYESIPHLLTPVVSSPKEASAVLANCVAEMERRYERLSSVRARNLNEANRAFRQRGEPTMPYLLVVIDELADLMMIAPQAVEDAVIRLAQKSRAVGIHLVLATQRPSVDVITGMIKANVPSRIAFAVSSMTDSRVILDQGGAESLLGQGDMLFKPLGTSRLQRVQGAYVSEEEIALVVEQTKQREQVLDEAYLELPEVFVDRK